MAKTDPPLLSVLATYVTKKRLSSRQLAAGPLSRNCRRAGGALHQRPDCSRDGRFAQPSLSLADVNVVVSNSMAARLRKCGVAEDQIHVIPNWTNDEEIVPVAHAENPLRRQWKLEDKFVVGYSGTSVAPTSMKLCLERHINCGTIRVLFLSSSEVDADFDILASACERAQCLISTFRLFRYHDCEQLKHSLSDIHWVSMKPNLEVAVSKQILWDSSCWARCTRAG